MRHTRAQLTTAAIALITSPLAYAVGAPQAVDSALQDTKFEEVIPMRRSILARPKPTQMAQKPRSILDLGDEKITPTAAPLPAPAPATPGLVDPKLDQENAAERKRMDTQLDRRMQSLQRLLQKEERKLEARLSDLNKKRELALEKADEKALKELEATEKQAVSDYEKRVQRLLDSATKTKDPQVTKKTAGTRPGLGSQPRNGNRFLKFPPRSPYGSGFSRNPAAEPAKKPEEPPKRRFRLWPFR